jgi:hypothetical protein
MAPERGFRKAVKAFAEGVSHMKDEADRASDQAIRAGLEMFQRNAEIAQRVLNSTAQVTLAVAERSFDQFGRALRVSAEHAEKSAQSPSTSRAFRASAEHADKGAQSNMEGSSSSVKAPVQYGTILTELTQRMCEEWAEIMRARMELGFDRTCALMQSPTPQDAAAVQREMLHDNIETFLGFARKAGECSARFSGETRRLFSNMAEGYYETKLVSFPFLPSSLRARPGSALGNSLRDE